MPSRQAPTGFTAGRTLTLGGEATTTVDTGAAGSTGAPLAAATGDAILTAPVLAAPVVGATGGTFAAGTFYYKVSATDAVGESLPSNEVSAVVALNGTVTLSWSSVGPATGYRVYRGTLAGAENVLVAAVAEGSVTYKLGQAIPGHIVAKLQHASALLSRRWIVPDNESYPRINIRPLKPKPTHLNSSERRALGG